MVYEFQTTWNKFEAFPPIFKNTLVIAEFMKKNVKDNKLLTQPGKMRISSFQFVSRTVNTPCFDFYLDLWLECTQIRRFVQYAPLKCFNNFVQSAVNARIERERNQHLSDVTETMKLLANSSNVYKILDRSQHKLTKYLNGQKAHNITINEFFKRLNYLNDKLFEVGSANSKVQHKEHVIFCFFLYYIMPYCAGLNFITFFSKVFVNSIRSR